MTQECPEGRGNGRLPSLNEGATLAHYRIDRHLGSGGMAEVYLATDQKLQRQVALKVLTDSTSRDVDLRGRFLREARAAAALNHTNIVTVYEVGESEGVMFIAMELINGETLRQHMQSRQLSLAEALDTARQICDGLGAAHSSGQVHCDIKPENIIIDEQGCVKLVDFGLTKALREYPAPQAGGIEGSLHYLAPEVIHGEPPSTAADLYSLGVVLYEMVSGQLPFQSDYEAGLVYSIANEEPRHLSELRGEVSSELEVVVMKLLAKDSDMRFESVGQVKERLQQLQSGEDDTDLPAATSYRDRLMRIGLPLVLAVLAFVVFFVIWTPTLNKEVAAKTVAVLPFENLGSPEDEYFADGITDAITSQLAKIRNLKVISRSSAMKYKDSNLSVGDIAAELEVGYLVTGTVHWDKSESAQEVRINVGLAKSTDDTYMWTESYRRVIDKIFAIQSDISSNVCAKLGAVVLEPEQAAIKSEPTANLQAYDLYLRGNDYFNRSWEREDIEIAIKMFQQATDLDSTFALAYVMLSRGHSSMYWEFYDRSAERRQAALQAASRALAIDPDLARAYLAIGYYNYHCELDYEAALVEFETGLALEPNNSDLFNAMAAVERRQGRLQASIENFKKALSLDPASHLKAFDVGLSYGMMRRFSEAERWLDRAIALAPDVSLPYIYKAWLQIFQGRDPAKAKAILAEAAPRCDLSCSKYYWWLARIVEPDLQAVLDQTAIGTDTVGYYLHVARISRLMDDFAAERDFSERARVILEKRVEHEQEEARYHSELGLAYTGLRQKQAALEHGQLAVQLLPTSREAFDAPLLLVNLTESLVVFDEFDLALDQLELLLSIPGFVSAEYLRLDPLWQPLRNHPRFQQILKAAA